MDQTERDSSNFTLVSAPLREALRHSEALLTSVEIEEGIHPGNSEIIYSVQFEDTTIYVLRAAQRIYVQVGVEGAEDAPSWQITGFDSGYNRVLVGSWCVDVEYTRGSVRLAFDGRVSIGRVLSKFVRTTPRFELSADIHQRSSRKMLLVTHTGINRPVCIAL